MLFFSRNLPWNQIFAPPPHFIVSEISLGIYQCRITFRTDLECIELAGLLITARTPHLCIKLQKLGNALASPKMVRFFWNFQNLFYSWETQIHLLCIYIFNCQNNSPGGAVKIQEVQNICCVMKLTIKISWRGENIHKEIMFRL